VVGKKKSSYLIYEYYHQAGNCIARFFYQMKCKDIKIGDLISWSGECYKVKEKHFAKFELSALWRDGIVIELDRRYIIVVTGTNDVFKIPTKNNAVMLRRVSKIDVSDV